MARVGNLEFFNSTTTRLSDNNNRLFELQRQLATGKRFERTSENPEAAQRASRLDSSIRRNDQLLRNIETNQKFLNEAETATVTAIAQLQRVRALAVQASNDTYTTADMRLVAAEINQQLEALVKTANTRTLGRSVFAGAEIDAAAFSVTRDSAGRISGVNYAGDDVELNIDADGAVPVTWPGSDVFASGRTVLASTRNSWDGGDVSSYADREISTQFIPSSGQLEGSLRINGKLINYDLDGDPTSAEGDSLLDLAEKINDAEAGVTARVTGAMESTVAQPLPAATFGALGGFTAGSFRINGATVAVTANDTIFTLADRINAANAGVAAAVFDANGNEIDGTPSPATAVGPVTIRLSGGAAISDEGAADTNILQILGITNGSASGQNLVGNVLQSYRLELSGNRPGSFTVEDASGSLAEDLGLLSSAAVLEGGTIFETLIQMRDALESGDNTTIRTVTLGEIDEALSSAQVTRTEAGVRTRRFELQKERIEQLNLTAKEIRSKLRDVDIAEVITELNTQQITQNAALRATSTILNLSLLNLL